MKTWLPTFTQNEVRANEVQVQSMDSIVLADNPSALASQKSG